MTTLLQGFAHAWPVRALGWTLLHFCWQGAMVAAVLWAALELLAGKPARVRYGAAVAALVVLIGLPLVTLLRVGAAEHRLAAAQGLAEVPALVVRAGLGDAASPWLVRAATVLDPLVPWLMLAWMLGAAVFCFRLGIGLEVTRRMRWVGVWEVSEDLYARFTALARQLGVRRAVRLLHSALVEAPTVIGWLRPVVLLPVSCLTGLDEAQLEAVLCHELAHVLRQDYLVSVVQGVVESLGFYHPAVWWISRQVRRERECCCDEIAVAVGGDRLAYARALTLLEAGRGAYPQVMLGANGGVLTMRIKRMLGASEGSAAGQAAAVVVLAMLATSAALAARAQEHLQGSGAASPALLAPVAVEAKVQLAAPVTVKPRVAVQPVLTAKVHVPADLVPAAEIAPIEPQQGPVRVAGGVVAGQIVSKVNPVYPKEAREAHISGTVVMRAIISKNGDVDNLQVISGPPELLPSALDAVRQWKYKPYLLNGEPTEVETTITVNYSFGVDQPAPTAQLDPGAALKPIGGRVQAPVLLYSAAPKYTAEARAKSISGTVLVRLQVDENGNATHVQVMRGLDSGLDQQAVAAVSQYRFKPAMEDGQPVRVEMNVEVNFQVF